MTTRALNGGSMPSGNGTRCRPERVPGMGFRIWGLGFRVQDLGFRVQGLGFRV